MFAYLSTVEQGLVDSAIRNRNSAFLLQCCAPFRCHLYKVIITFSLIGHEKIIQRIPITNVNCHWWVWILFSFGFLTGPSVCIKYLMHGSILHVTIPPPGQPRGQVQPFGPGGGALFETVLSRGEGGGANRKQLLVLVKYVTSR